MLTRYNHIIMKDKRQPHFLLWIAIGILYCAVAITIVMIFIYVEDREHLKIFSLEGFLGTMGTFIAICAAIMLGSQIYSVYSRAQSEKEYNEKLDDVTDKFISFYQENTSELVKLKKSNDTLYILKYLVNDAMGGVHHSEGRVLEGAIDVMENIYTIVCNEDLFVSYFDDYKETLDAECYFIAKNLKEYTIDKLVKDRNIKGLMRLQRRWQKRYVRLDNTTNSYQHIKDRIEPLDEIFNRLIDNLIYSKCDKRMEPEDLKKLDNIIENKLPKRNNKSS